MELSPTFRYNISKTYEENLIVPQPESIRFLDFELCSRIGIAAGPILNSDWVRVYADLGYSVLTYKTVRTEAFPAYSWPNILYVDAPERLNPRALPGKLVASLIKSRTITNSFGMPSVHPRDWMPDVGKAKTYLHKGQILVVSVVGEDPEDFACCVKWAREAGADMVEVNLSCPNKPSIYNKPMEVETTLKAIREKVPFGVPLALKMGYFYDLGLLKEVAATAGKWVDVFVAINGVKVPIETQFPFRKESGICGWAIRDMGLYNVRELCRLGYTVIGCGGIMSEEDVQEYLDAGAVLAEIATTAIFDPLLATRWKMR